MRQLLALWRRELRAHALSLLGLLAIGVAVDVLLLRESNIVGDVSPFDRPLSALLPYIFVVAAVMASRVFVGEGQRGTWSWLFSLPIHPWALIGAKLTLVVGVTVGLVWWRLTIHAALGSPEPWLALAIRVVARATVVAVLVATTLSAVALSGRRALLGSLVTLIALNVVTDLLGVSFLREGPLGLVNGSMAGVDDRSWPTEPIAAALLLAALAAVVPFALVRHGTLPAWLDRPWSWRGQMVMAALVGAGGVVGVSALERGINALPDGLDVGAAGVVLLPVAADTPLPEGSGLGDAGQAACVRVLSLMERALPGLTRPRVILVRRDDSAAATGAYLDDATVQIVAAPSATPASVASALATAMLWRLRPAENGPVDFALAGVPPAVGQFVAPSPTKTRTLVSRRATCEDARAWITFREGCGATSSAAAFFHDLVAAHGEAALVATIAAVGRGERDIMAILEAGAPVCATPPPHTDAPWVIVGEGLTATVALRDVSGLTAAPFVHLHPGRLTPSSRARVVVRQRHVVNAGRPTTILDEHVPADTLFEGALLGVAVARGTPLDVEVGFDATLDGQAVRACTGMIRLEAP